jgi:Flp pilus assembly protein TadG
LLSRVIADEGSAVAEFVIVLVPVSLLILPLVEIQALLHEKVVTQQVAFDVARFATLADSTAATSQSYLLSKGVELKLNMVNTEDGCFSEVKVTSSHQITFWPTPLDIEGNAIAQCELF